ncbi:hypothetical protein GPECTOR_67g302 [Gonium pectorale]|uniref:Uncharacterized protein n=1 Tax=Gonium pectorale TaxID=33097 RepID=A0A150G3K8_GONPE|nr:hypothetical protein GPECTOR_67g302 [Gonium pectorale]|eukprot:KXZ44462.1 hypothetical protein GPECTOR_67g302 [Gonium pectorale]
MDSIVPYFVQSAVSVWEDPTNPAGWQQFSRLTLVAEIRPGPGLEDAKRPTCPSFTAPLQLDTRSTDLYLDEGRRFQGVKQLRFTLEGLSYREFFLCERQVRLLQQMPGNGANSTLAVLPPAAEPTQAYSIQIDKAVGPRSCPTRSDMCNVGTNFRNCRSNCEDYFGAQFSCNGGVYTCYLNNAYYNNYALKVKYSRAADGTGSYVPDFTFPGLGGGANAMPYGFVRQFATGNFSGGPAAGPVFQLRNITPPNANGLRTQPGSFSITVRSSSDPWLSYMAATGGSGYFGVAKRTLVASGVVLVVVGCLGTLFWCLALFTAWRLLCSRHRPTSRPPGVQGYAWDLANRYGGSYAPAIGVPVHGTGHDGMPTAQPLYGAAGQYSHEPVTGMPATGYPYPYPPYGVAPGGPYGNPYGVPAYPPGAQVEMAQYPYGYGYPPAPAPDSQQQQQAAAQGYGYPPPPGTQAPGGAAQTAAGGADAGATAAYAYPYSYPYPQYGQPPQAAPAAASPGSGGATASLLPAGAEGGPSGAGPSGFPAAGGAGPSGSNPAGSQPSAYPKA